MSGFSQKSITPVHQRRVHNSLPRGQCNNSVLEISQNVLPNSKQPSTLMFDGYMKLQCVLGLKYKDLNMLKLDDKM